MGSTEEVGELEREVGPEVRGEVLIERDFYLEHRAARLLSFTVG